MSLTRIGSIGINTGIAFAGVTTIVTLNTANDALSIGATVNVGSGITLGASGDIFATGVSTFSGNLKVGSGVTISPDGDGFYTGVVTATTFSGALSGSGANITAINASNIASGTVPTARLGSGTASSSTFLRGDSTFAAVTSTTINSNADNRLITGSGTANTLEAESNVHVNGGILIAGHTSSTTVSDGEGPFIQVKSTDSRGGISLLRHSANANSGGVYIAKSRNATIGSNTIVQDDDELGRITFSGDDGTNIHTQAAAIHAFVDGTPGENDMPGRLTFYTTADGAASPTERLRIDSSGRLLVGTTTSDAHTAADDIVIAKAGKVGLTLNSTDSDASHIYFADSASNPGAYAGYFEFHHGTDTLKYGTGNNERFRIDSSGRMVIGSTSPHTGAKLTVAGNGLCITGQNIAHLTNSLCIGEEGSGVAQLRAYGSDSSTFGQLDILLSASDGSGNNGLISIKRQGLDGSTIVLPTGGALCFEGSTAAGNKLDDYEEGTFTPTIEFSSGTSVSYSGSSRNAEYVKVGSLVYIRLFVYASSTGSNTGQLKVGGLPFTPNSGGYGRHACSVTGGTFNLGSNLAGLFGLIEESVAKIDIYAGSVNGANTTISSSMWNGSGMYVAGVYHVLGY